MYLHVALFLSVVLHIWQVLSIQKLIAFKYGGIFLNYFFNYFFPSFCSALSYENSYSDTEPHGLALQVFHPPSYFPSSCLFAPLSCRFPQFYFLFGFSDFDNIFLISSVLYCSLNISLTDLYLFYKDAMSLLVSQAINDRLCFNLCFLLSTWSPL